MTAGESRTNERDVYVPKGRQYGSSILSFPGLQMGACRGNGQICCLDAVSIGSVFGWIGREAGRPDSVSVHRGGLVARRALDVLRRQWGERVITFGGSGFRMGLPSNLPLEQRKNMESPWRRTESRWSPPIGSQQGTVSVHTPAGDQQVSMEKFAYLPSLSADGRTLYYLARKNVGAFLSGELWLFDLNSGHKEQLVPGISIGRYSVSPDGKKVAFTRADSGSHSGIWIWPLDRHASPRQLLTAEADTPIFARNGEILFSMKEGAFDYIFRMKEDGTDLRKAIPDPVDASHQSVS